MKMEIVIPESATLQSFLLLLFSKCQHSYDFIGFWQTTQKNKVLSHKNNVLAATYLKIIRKHYDVIVVLWKSSKISGLLTFGKQK